MFLCLFSILLCAHSSSCCPPPSSSALSASSWNCSCLVVLFLFFLLLLVCLPLLLQFLFLAFSVFFQFLPLRFVAASCLSLVLFLLSFFLCLPACFLIFLFFCLFSPAFSTRCICEFFRVCSGKGPRPEDRRRNLFFPFAIRTPVLKLWHQSVETDTNRSLTI